MLKTGKLKDLIQIIRFEETENDYGQLERKEILEAQRWARIRPLSGRELWDAQQIHADLTHEIQMHFYRKLNPRHRLRHGNRTFEIVSVRDVDERHREQLVSAIERQNTEE